MTTGFRQVARLLGAAAIVALTATPALAQNWGTGQGGPRGRAVRVEQGRARPCPPGHQRQGRCGWNDVRRGGQDWCWDRNRDARCDRVAARVDRRRDSNRPRDDRWPRDGRWPGDVPVRDRRDLPDRGSLSNGVAELLRRSGIAGIIDR
jgi:hypothetical protein